LLRGGAVVPARERSGRVRRRREAPARRARDGHVPAAAARGAAVVRVGAAAAVSVHGGLGYLALALVVGLMGPRAWARAPVVVPAGAAVVLLTALVHAVFFGAGRYGLVVA